MKSFVYLAGGTVAAMLLAGCGPELAQAPLGSDEAAWEKTIKGSYPGWQPPRIAPPAVKDKFVDGVATDNPSEPAMTTTTTEVVTEEISTTSNTTPPAAASDLAAPAANDDGIAGELPVETPKPTAAAKPADTTKPADAAKTADTAKTAAPVEGVATAGAAKSADGTVAAEGKDAAPAVSYTEYVVVKGDSLSLISRKVYKDGRLYYQILKANEDQFKNNPNRLYPGMKLRIPALPKK